MMANMPPNAAEMMANMPPGAMAGIQQMMGMNGPNQSPMYHPSPIVMPH